MPLLLPLNQELLICSTHATRAQAASVYDMWQAVQWQVGQKTEEQIRQWAQGREQREEQQIWQEKGIRTALGRVQG